MSVVVSPGVYAAEIDFSLYAPQLATSILGMVGSASKGPTDEITLITDEASLVNTFGEPSAIHMGLFAAIRYLRRGRQLKFVRVADYDIAASVVIAAAAATATAVSTGTWGNTISVVVADSTFYAGTKRISILYGTATVEVYDNCVIGSPSDTNYWATKINSSSDYITISGVNDAVTPTNGTYVLSGGDDGTPLNNSDIIGVAGSPPTVPATGFQLFRNSEVVDVNLLACPDSQHRAIITEMVNICESRGDCMALVDPPQNLSVQDVVDWHNGTGSQTGAPTAALDSSYAALYYPWLQVYDGFSDAEVWVPPSGHVAGVIAYTDFVAEPWWAPAGLNRAKLSDVLAVEHSATQGERDFMYSGGNSVNPIIAMSGQGTVIWGQRTLQRASTALDRINVRRLLLYLRKVIATSVRSLLFEPNDPQTWRQFVRLITPVLDTIKGRRGITDFKVVCDETTNTSDVIDRNEMHGKILIQPTKTAEIITIDFVLLSSGAKFEEFV